MVDTCAAEFAAETPYFYATYAAAGSPPEAPPVERPGGARHRLGAGPHRPGHRVRLLRRPGRRHAARGRLAGGDDQLEPGDRLDRLRRLVAALLRAARPGERAERHRRRDRPDGATCCRRSCQFGGQTPLNLAAPLAAAGVPLLGSGSRGHRPGRGADAVLGAARPARHPAARGRDGPQRRGGADARRADRLPGHRPAVVRHRRARHRLLLLARATSPGSWRRPRSWTRTGPSASTATSRASRSTSTPSPTASECSSRASSSTSSGPASTRATRSACSRRRPCREGDQDLIVATMERIVPRARRARARQRPVHRPRRRRLPDRGQPARVADRAVHVEGDRRPDGRAGRPDLARARRSRSSAGTAGCSRRRRSSRSRRRPSRRPSCAASTRRSGRGCSRPAR